MNGPCELHVYNKPGNVTGAWATSREREVLAFHVNLTVNSYAKNARPPLEAIRIYHLRIDMLLISPRIAIAPNNATEYSTA